MSLVSIIVPIYNAEKTLSRCIESLIKQTLWDMEIILVDDGSTDGSADICNLYSQNDSRIIVIHKKNEGVSKTRNAGLKKVTSDYVLFVDSDDYIEHSMCEVLYKEIINTKYEVVMCGFERRFIFNGKVKRSEIILPGIQSVGNMREFEDNWCNLYKKSFFNAPWGKLYKVDYIKKNNISFEEELDCGEDLLFNLEVFGYINKIAVVNEPLYIYECTEKESLTTKLDLKKEHNDKYLYNTTLNYLDKMNMLKACEGEVARIYMRSCFRTFEQILLLENGLDSNEKKMHIKNILSCKETKKALYSNQTKSLESYIYLLILRTNSYSIVSHFTKIRFKYKMFLRKGFNFENQEVSAR
ncbi:MAG: glycosyltransferase [Solibacillus sp.]